MNFRNGIGIFLFTIMIFAIGQSIAISTSAKEYDSPEVTCCTKLVGDKSVCLSSTQKCAFSWNRSTIFGLVVGVISVLIVIISVVSRMAMDCEPENSFDGTPFSADEPTNLAQGESDDEDCILVVSPSNDAVEMAKILGEIEQLDQYQEPAQDATTVKEHYHVGAPDLFNPANSPYTGNGNSFTPHNTGLSITEFINN